MAAERPFRGWNKPRSADYQEGWRHLEAWLNLWFQLDLKSEETGDIMLIKRKIKRQLGMLSEPAIGSPITSPDWTLYESN